MVEADIFSPTGGDLLIQVYRKTLETNPDMANAVAAVSALTELVKASKSSTIMEMTHEIEKAIDALAAVNESSISLLAACQLFQRYLSNAAVHIPDFNSCKNLLIERGTKFADKSLRARNRIAELGHQFIRDGAVMMTHGFSRVVIATLLLAAARGRRFTVLVTESCPDGAGYETAEKLAKAGVPSTVIPDAAVGYSMLKVDAVILGAEGVVENGGIINKIGSYQLAMVAHMLHKPVYVAAESYKFVRQYPLNQADIRQYRSSELPRGLKKPLDPLVKLDYPSVDFTPPAHLTLLFTDLGVLTPSAVSDELIKLWY